MPLPVIAGCTRVALIWRHPNYARAAVNVLHVADGGDDPADLAPKLDAAANENMWEPVDPDATVEEIHLTPLDGSSASLVYVPETPNSWTGNAGQSDSVPNEPALVKHATAKRGPAYRGRTFLPFTAEAQIANGQLNSTTRTNLTSGWTAWIEALLVVDRPFVIASYVNQTKEPVTASTAEQYLATQRRRQPRP